MVLQNKLKPQLAHKLVFKHPVVVQREKLANDMQKDKEKVN